jgi:hypothetical protein
MSKQSIGATVFVLIGLPAMVVGLWSAIGRPFIKLREAIVIADVPRPAFGLLYVAQAKGYFREEGIDVTFRGEQANDILSRYLSDASGDNFRYSWDDYLFELKLNNVMLNLFRQRMEWLTRNDSHLRAVPDIRQLIFSDYLRQVAPKAVTIRNTIG